MMAISDIDNIVDWCWDVYDYIPMCTTITSLATPSLATSFCNWVRVWWDPMIGYVLSRDDVRLQKITSFIVKADSITRTTKTNEVLKSRTERWNHQTNAHLRRVALQYERRDFWAPKEKFLRRLTTLPPPTTFCCWKSLSSSNTLPHHSREPDAGIRTKRENRCFHVLTTKWCCVFENFHL